MNKRVLVEWVEWFGPKREKSLGKQRELLAQYAERGYSLVAAVPTTESYGTTTGILLYFAA